MTVMNRSHRAQPRPNRAQARSQATAPTAPPPIGGAGAGAGAVTPPKPPTAPKPRRGDHVTPQDRALNALTGLLADERLRPPRVVARKVMDLLDSLNMLAAEPEPTTKAGQLVTLPKRRQEPPSWLTFVDRLPADVDPIAVTRNRTRSALEALGLRPEDVRAVVIEQDYLRVYRWTDRTEAAQTVPILEDKETA